MAVELSVDGPRGPMRVKASGEVTDQEWSDTLGAALDEHGSEVDSLIIDVRECESRPASAFISDGAAWLSTAPKGAFPSRWAVIVASPRSLGTTEMLSEAVSTGHVTVRAFTDPAQAEEWATATEQVSTGELETV